MTEREIQEFEAAVGLGRANDQGIRAAAHAKTLDDEQIERWEEHRHKIIDVLDLHADWLLEAARMRLAATAQAFDGEPASTPTETEIDLRQAPETCDLCGRRVDPDPCVNVACPRAKCPLDWRNRRGVAEVVMPQRDWSDFAG